MTNFSVFSKANLAKLLEPFAPGMSEHATPIKYEALTPDAFLLLFRTTGKDGHDHFFVSFESDFIQNLESAKCTIVDWYGEIIGFWSSKGKQPTDDTTSDLDDFCSPTSGAYKAVLAEVERPTKKGYWAEATKIMPGDNIGEKINNYSKEEQAEIRKTLASILQHKVSPRASFLDSLQAKHENTMTNDINQTDMAVSLYVQPDGKVEFFYNYVHLKPKN